MRLSTLSYYQQSLSAVNSQQSDLLKVQQQLGAGTKIVTPSDDPIGATKAVALTQSIALTSQYSTNRAAATSSLSNEDTTLSNVVTTLQNIKGLVVQAATGTLSDADRASVATELQGNYDQLLGLANSDDGNGSRVFAGFKSGSDPFVTDNSGNIQYVGDQGTRLIQVDSSRQLSITDTGKTVFQSVSTGAGYVTSAGTANTGSAVVGPATVVDAGAANYGSDFSLTFNSATTYTVTTKSIPSVTVGTGTYTAGTPVTFAGLQMSVTGTPAAGDTLDVSTAKNAGTDMFANLKQLITALQTPLANATDAQKAAFQNTIGTANTKLDNSLDNVLQVRSAVGAKLNEIDALETDDSAKTLANKTELSSVQDLDYTSTISQFYQRQTALEATQKVFVSIQKISLLNYLN